MTIITTQERLYSDTLEESDSLKSSDKPCKALSIKQKNKVVQIVQIIYAIMLVSKREFR